MVCLLLILTGLSLLLRSATALLSETRKQATEARVLSIRHGGQKGFRAWEPHGALLFIGTVCSQLPCASGCALAPRPMPSHPGCQVTQATMSPRPAAMPLEDGKRWTVIKPGVCRSCWFLAWWWWRLY